MKYYDLILAGIPAALGAGLFVGAVTALPVNIGVALGGVASAGFMYHGMFHRAPV